MTLEEIITILSETYDKKYVLRRDLKQASSVAKVYRDYIVELWHVDIRNPENNLCTLSAHEIGQWTDRNRNELVKSVETKFMKQLLDSIKNNTL